MYSRVTDFLIILPTPIFRAALQAHLGTIPCTPKHPPDLDECFCVVDKGSP